MQSALTPLFMILGMGYAGISYAMDDLFLGTYEGQSRACEGSKLVLTKKTFSWYQCRRVPYQLIQDEVEQIAIQVPQRETCPFPIVRIRRPNPTVLSRDIYAYKSLENFQDNKPQLICTYGTGR